MEMMDYDSHANQVSTEQVGAHQSAIFSKNTTVFSLDLEED